MNPSSSANRSPWWKRGRVHVPGFDVLTIFCLLLVLIHGAIEFSGGVIAYEGLYTQGLGLSSDGLKGGKVWQLLSYSLLHGGWFHLVTNLFMLWIMGGRLMHIIGQKKLALTMLLSSIGGGLVFVLFDLLSGVSRPLVGASGIAFGLFILMAMLGPCARVRPFPVTAKNMAYGVLIASLTFCLVNPNLGLPMLQSAGLWLQDMHLADVFRIAHSCHLGGGLVGFYISSKVMGKLVTLDQLRKQRID